MELKIPSLTFSLLVEIILVTVIMLTSHYWIQFDWVITYMLAKKRS